MWRTIRILGMSIFLVILGLAGGVFLDRGLLLGYIPPANISPKAQTDFHLMAEAWNLIQKDYVDRQAVQAKNLTYGAISGMVNALGDTGHSRFLTPEMVSQEQNMTNGEFEGVGLEVQDKNGQVVIVTPIDNSPAQRAGLKAGEIITKVDGKDISGQALSDVVTLIMGPAGSKVTLTILDPQTGNTQDVTLTRARITIQNVSWKPVPGTKIADLRISAFSQGVGNDLQKALKEIQNQGMQGIILDLRNNPGGLLSEAINVSSQFIQSGNALEVQDAQGKITPIPVSPNGPVNNLPMVVLVNNGTASAAEIVTAALKDSGRATVIGETTFGTGTVLNEFPLSDGSALFLATEEWLTPNGKTIWHQGITPSMVVQLPADATQIAPDMIQQMTTAQVQASGDAQFLKGMSVLQQTVKAQQVK
jgi:carboxyl-terminal processing protease